MGQRRGGNGVVRRVEFRAPMTAAILSNNRRTKPLGLNGGAPGKAGRNLVIRQGDQTEVVDPVEELQLQTGDTLIIKTPGGGGYGSPPQTD